MYAKIGIPLLKLSGFVDVPMATVGLDRAPNLINKTLLVSVNTKIGLKITKNNNRYR